MRKVTVIFICCYLFAGCSVLKGPAGKSGNVSMNPSRVTGNTLIANNITNENFSIPRVDVDVNSQGDHQKFLATVKYKAGEGYLISLRSRTGFEAARIFLGQDTLLINDRLSRTLYYGKPGNLRNITGYSGELLPLIFGDILTRQQSSAEIQCIDGKGQIEDDFSGYRIGYRIDCRMHKITEILHENSFNNAQTILTFDNFVEENGRIYPRTATINAKSAESSIIMVYNQIEFNWQGELEFVPGSNYERRQLK